MDLTTFFKKFDQFADAPDAVAKLRDLVLHLALTGKLVRQNPKEQEAAVLLAAVKQSQDLLFERGEIRRTASQPALTSDEMPFECPAGWAWVRFGEISYSYRGHNPPKSVFKDQPTPGYVRFIQQRDFRTDHHAVYVPESRQLKLVKKGEIVMAAYGNIGNTCRTVEGAFNVAIAKVMEIPPIERDYVDLLIRSDFIRGALGKVSSRVAVPSMSSDHMRSLAVPLPPLAEQKRIVAKVDELMALCDRLEEQQQEREKRHAALARASLTRFATAPTPANLNLIFHPSYTVSPADLRKSILTLAVQGHLSGNPASVVEEQTASLDSATDPQFPISYGVLKPGPQVPNGVRLVKSQHIRDWRVSENIDCLISAELDAEFKRTKIKGGEVLLNLVGASIGRCAIAPTSLKGANVSRAVAVITLRPTVDPKFFLVLLTAAFTPARIEELSSGTAQPVLNLGVIRKMQVWLPPIAEQRQIVAKVDQLMALVDALEQQLAASRATAEKLLAAVVVRLHAA